MTHNDLTRLILPTTAAHDYFLQAMVLEGKDRDEWAAKGIKRLQDAVENAGYRMVPANDLEKVA